MPELSIGDMDVRALSPTTRKVYIQTVKYQQRAYYWMLMLLGCVFFLMGATV